MMLLYHRVLLRELLWNVAFTFATVSFVFGVALAVQIIYRASQLAPVLFLKMMPLLLLKTLPIVIPLSLLVGVVMTFGRVAADGELLTLKAAGIHPFWVMPPALFLGAVGFVTTLVINDSLAPRADYLSRSLLSEEDLRTMLEARLRQGQREVSLGDYELHWVSEMIEPLVEFEEGVELPMLVAGPFDWRDGQRPPPESGAIDPSLVFEEIGSGWQRISRGADGWLDLPGSAPAGSSAVFYGVTHLWCARPVHMDLTVSPGEQVAVRLGDLRQPSRWLTGSGHGEASPTGGDRQLDLRLAAGWNELLLRLPAGPARYRVRLGRRGPAARAVDVRAAPLPGTICLLDLTVLPKRGDRKHPEESPIVVAGMGIIGFDAARNAASIDLRNARALRGGNISGERVTYQIKLARSARVHKLSHRSGAELYALTDRLRRQPENPIPLASVQTQLYKRLVTSASCLVFVILGLPIAIIFKSANRMASFLLAFAIVLFFYYPTLLLGESLADQGFVDPGLAMWSGSILLTGLGATLLAVVVRR